MRLTIFLAWVALAACRSGGTLGPYTPVEEGKRDPQRAQELTQKAAAVFEEDPAESERLLRDALTADLFHGPAHNNLGILYLQQGKLYEAANEFEWARKLLPGLPDPRLNLGLTLETAGHTDEAIENYRSALEVYPDHIPSMQALVRLLVRSGRDTPDLPKMIRSISLRGETEEWRDKAREQLAKLHHEESGR